MYGSDGVETLEETEISSKEVALLDKVISQLDLEEIKKAEGREGKKGLPDLAVACLVITDIKPTAVLDKVYAEKFWPLIENADPIFSQNFDVLPVAGDMSLLVNKDATIAIFRDNPDYFPQVNDYQQAADFLKERFDTRMMKKDRLDPNVIRDQIMTGVVLGYPKGDCELMSNFDPKVDSQIRKYLSPEEAQKLGLTENDIDTVRHYYAEVKDVVEGVKLEPEIRRILGLIPGVEEGTIDYFLRGGVGFGAYEMGWRGTHDSEESKQKELEIRQKVKQEGLDKLFAKYDITEDY